MSITAEKTFLTQDEKEEMAQENIRLAHYFANKYKNLPYPYEEILSAAMFGLTKALNDFDPSKGFKFSTFAGRVIIYEILKIERTEKKHLNNISIETHKYTGDKGKEITILDTLSFMPEETDDWEGVNEAVNKVLKKVDAKKKQIFELFAQGKTQQEIGEVVGRSQVQISRLLRKIFAEIKEVYWESEKEMDSVALTKEKLEKHLAEGKSTDEIAELEGVSRSAVYSMKSKYGFSKKRDKKEKLPKQLETVKEEVQQVIIDNPSKIQELENLIAKLEEEVAAYKMNEVILIKQLDKLRDENSNLMASAEDTESEAYAAALNLKELATKNAELTEELEMVRENRKIAEVDCALLSGKNKELSDKLAAVERKLSLASGLLKEVL